MSSPSISALMRVHDAEEHVRQSLEAILTQTHPPDEVVVIDDGSTDETPSELGRFHGDIRVVRQANGGYADAFNRGFREVGGDYVANCDADDIWEPNKLERQVEALRNHPEIDIAFSGARFFGSKQGPRAPYAGEGLMERRVFARHLYRANFICTSSTVVRRSLFLQIGPLKEMVCEDYDYWLRALAAGAVFYSDPGILVRYRAHSQQVSNDLLHMHEQEYQVHRLHRELVAARLARKVQARDLSNVARALSDQGHLGEARALFVSSLRHRPTLRVLAWVTVLSLPTGLARPLADRLVSIKRALLSAFRRSASNHLPT